MNKVPALDETNESNRALSLATGAAHYWYQKAQERSKHRTRVFTIGVIAGLILAEIAHSELGPKLFTWASSAF